MNIHLVQDFLWQLNQIQSPGLHLKRKNFFLVIVLVRIKHPVHKTTHDRGRFCCADEGWGAD
jgi:hypothetical protein